MGLNTDVAYLTMRGTAYLDGPIEIIPGVVSLKGRQLGGSSAPGPIFSLAVIQPTKLDKQHFVPGFEGQICIALDANPRCLNVAVHASTAVLRRGGRSRSRGRRLMDNSEESESPEELEAEQAAELRRIAPWMQAEAEARENAAAWPGGSYGADPFSKRKLRRSSSELPMPSSDLALAAAADDSEDEYLSRRRLTHRRLLAFESFSFEGRYTSGNIVPLRGIVPGGLDELITIHGTEADPLELNLTSYPKLDLIEIQFLCRLEFQLPAILGAPPLDFTIDVEGAWYQGKPVFCFGPKDMGDLSLPGGLSFEGLRITISTYPDSFPKTTPLTSGSELAIPRGITLFYEGQSPVPALCSGFMVILFSLQAPTAARFEGMCGDMSLKMFNR